MALYPLMRAREPSFPAMIAGLESRGLSRDEIARRAGLSRTTIWRGLNGTNKDHLSETVARIERVWRREENPRVKQK